MGSAHGYSHSYYNSGLAKAKLGDLSGADSDFGLAIAHNPKDPVAFKDRGEVRLRLRNVVGALDDFSQAVRLDHRYARAQGLLAYARFRTGDLHGALAESGRALKEDPTESWALSTRGLVLAQLAELAQAAQQDPEKGCERNQTDDFFVEAVGDCEEAVRLEPGNVAMLAYLAYVRLLSGDVEGARADSQLALKVDPCNCDARAAYGGVLAAQGDLSRGVVQCCDALQSDPGNPLAIERLRSLREKASQAIGTSTPAEVSTENGLPPPPVRNEAGYVFPRATPRPVGSQRDLAFSFREGDEAPVAEFTEDFEATGLSQSCYLLSCMPVRPERKPACKPSSWLAMDRNYEKDEWAEEIGFRERL